MRKWLILMICAVFALSLTSCTSARRTLDAYNDIGSITLSDDRFLTEEEQHAIEKLRDRREEAYRNKDVDELVRIKGEWESMKAPMQAIIDRYAAVNAGLFTKEQEGLLTDQEKKTYDSGMKAVRAAYEAGDRETLKQEMDELGAFCDNLKKVFEVYARIDRSPVPDNLRKFTPEKDLADYERLSEDTDRAFLERDAEAMSALESEWSAFRRTLEKDIADAQEAYLQDAVSGLDFGGSMVTLFSLGTIQQTTELQGHTIVICVKYMYDIDDEKASADLNSYLSTYSSYLQSIVDDFQKDISDVRLRVEYLNKNGSVVASKEFQ